MYPKAPLRSSLSILKTATNSHASRLSSIRRFSSSPIAAKSAIVTGSARGMLVTQSAPSSHTHS